MDESEVPRLLRVKEVAELTGIERWRVYEIVAAGELPHMRVGRTIRVSERALMAWIEEEHLRVPRRDED